MKTMKWLAFILIPIVVIVMIAGSVEYILHHAKFSFELNSGNMNYIKNEAIDGIWENYSGDIHFHLKTDGIVYEVNNKRKTNDCVHIPGIVDQTYIKNRRKLTHEEVLKLGNFKPEEIRNQTYYRIDEVKLVYESKSLSSDMIHRGQYVDEISFIEKPEKGTLFIQSIEKNQDGEYTSFYHIDQNHKVELMDTVYNHTQDQGSNHYRITRKKDVSFPACIYKEQNGLLEKIADLPIAYIPYNIYVNKSYIYISCIKDDIYCVLKYDLKGNLLKKYNHLPKDISKKRIENVYQNDGYMIVLNADEVIIYDEKSNLVIKTYNRSVFESKIPFFKIEM